MPAATYRLVLTGTGGRAGSGVGRTVGMVKLIPATHAVCWRFTGAPKVVVKSAALGRVQMTLRPRNASIHQGGKRANGPEIVPLDARYRQRGCVAVAPEVINSIAAAPRFYYLRLDVTARPAGILRAQL